MMSADLMKRDKQWSYGVWCYDEQWNLNQCYNLMIRWNPSLYSLIGFVTLPRRFRLGIVSGEEVSHSYKAGSSSPTMLHTVW